MRGASAAAPSVSSARTANPSIAARSNGGTSAVAVIVSARTRPLAAARGMRSVRAIGGPPRAFAPALRRRESCQRRASWISCNSELPNSTSQRVRRTRGDGPPDKPLRGLSARTLESCFWEFSLTASSSSELPHHMSELGQDQFLHGQPHCLLRSGQRKHHASCGSCRRRRGSASRRRRSVRS